MVKSYVGAEDMQYEAEHPGLGDEATLDWPAPLGEDASAIQRLQEDNALHDKVLAYLVERIEDSERAMSQFYERWEANELRVQAYIDLKEHERILKARNDKGKPPAITSIVIPYSYASVLAVVTYMLHTFAGRKPMWSVGAEKQESMAAARNMETVLQYQSDHTRMVRQLAQFFQDGQIYGVSVLRCAWSEQWAARTVWKSVDQGPLGQVVGQMLPVKEPRLVYEGNLVEVQDPFLFFPDPRVPMSEVARRGEYVAWRSYVGKHTLKRMEAAGEIVGLDRVPQRMPQSNVGEMSQRSRRALGEAQPGANSNATQRRQPFYQVDQGSFEIIPAELGLGDGEVPEKWMFAIANKGRIVQAAPLGYDHDMHPVVVAEPNSLGYGFGHLSKVDFLTPLQDGMSWLFNSHIYNVRTALNNMFIVDPSMVEMQDLKNPEAGKLVRLKRAAYGRDVRTALTQLQTIDITRSHLQDINAFMQIAEKIAVSENFMGQQASGGRKTATEVRSANELGGSRLAAEARVISAQAFCDLALQMSMNTQQYLSDEFYLEVVGSDGLKAPIRITPESLVGDFHFPVHDGTLPLDKVALLDVWKEIFLAVAQDPQLRMVYSLPKIFEYLAELGGARNIESMRLVANPDDALQQQLAAGNVVPLGEAERAGALGGAPGAGGSSVVGQGRPANRARGRLV